MKPSVTSVQVIRAGGQDSDLLAVEEPMQISISFGAEQDRQAMDLAVTMRTPGRDFELAIGFLFTEGIITDYKDVLSIRYCQQAKSQEEAENIVRVSLAIHVSLDPKALKRNFYATSSCGICGKASIGQIKTSNRVVASNAVFSLKHILNAPEVLIDNQKVFQYTGGIHACGLFDASGDLIELCEDVGRHNAFDKLVGYIIINEIETENCFVVVSGRASFELVQKAVVTGLPLFAAVGAPSSLAVALAKERNITLIGFIRGMAYNIYSGEERILL